MAEFQPLEPLSLNSWPTCKNCLAWSGDDLAVAGGEVVHIISPRDLRTTFESTSRHWHVDTVRVNQFEEHEWPAQELATLKDFSIGEEQSNSTITALNWSQAGLGRHRRSVLAILTSNLVLSLWESDGVTGTWRRTSVVNPSLKSENLTSRRNQRIRAFKWLPPLYLGPGKSAQRFHYLLVADDDDTLNIIEIRRDLRSRRDNLQTSIVWKHKVNAEHPAEDRAGQPLSLRVLLENGPITQIDTGGWKIGKNHQPIGKKLLRLNLNIYRGGYKESLHAKTYVLEAEILENASELKSALVEASIRRDAVPRTIPLEVSPPEPGEIVLAKPCAEFNKQFDLKGRYRVRHWGSAYSTDQMVVASCITLHPSDMIEYTTPSMERCTIVFDPPIIARSGVNTSNSSVTQKQILSFITEHACCENTASELDKRIVQVASAFIQAAFNRHESLAKWSWKAEKDILADDVADQPTGDANQMSRSTGSVNPASHAEPCEVCGAAITISDDLSITRCSRGHRFTRCNISFLAIQEPGVSKYCSRCGKQFLDLLKLEPPEGPSLSQALFEEFDVCPYCQGKFRG